jgi:hypothetical protein
MHSCVFFFVKQPPASGITLVMPGSYLKPLRPLPCHLLPSYPLMPALPFLPPLCLASPLPPSPSPLLCPTSRLFPRFSLKFSSSTSPLPHLSTFLLYTPFFHFTFAYALLPSLCLASRPLVYVKPACLSPPLSPSLPPFYIISAPPLFCPPLYPNYAKLIPRPPFMPVLCFFSLLSFPPLCPAFLLSPSLSFYAPLCPASSLFLTYDLLSPISLSPSIQLHRTYQLWPKSCQFIHLSRTYVNFLNFPPLITNFSRFSNVMPYFSPFAPIMSNFYIFAHLSPTFHVLPNLPPKPKLCQTPHVLL